MFDAYNPEDHPAGVSESLIRISCPSKPESGFDQPLCSVVQLISVHFVFFE
jgi:hypothetical protein